MSALDIAPAVSLALTLAFGMRISLSPTRGSWQAAALLSAVFAAYSVATVAEEGLWGFYENHSQNLWGLQVFLDLLFAVSVAWFLLLPRARAAGMGLPALWFALVCATGSIGLFAALSRLLYLEQRAAAEPRRAE